MKSAIIIGGGPAGCAAAHQLRQRGFAVTLIERMSELGAGARTHWYATQPFTFGPRHTLTKSQKVWDYLDAICPLRRTPDHEFWSFAPADGQFYNFPIHVNDINRMPDADRIMSELTDVNADAINYQPPNNLAEFWQNAVGDTLYRKLIKGYTEKMWQMPCEALDTFTWSPKGQPIKMGNRAAWDDALSGYPIAPDGYNGWFDRCVEGCDVRLNTNITWFDIPDKHIHIGREILTADIIVNTISPDILFSYAHGHLPYIGRDFHKIVLPVEFALPEHVYFIYETGKEAWTRVTEFKKFTRHQSPYTLLGLEIPSHNGRHYPIPTKREQARAAKYHAMMPRDVYSIGRAGSYRYAVDIAGSIEQAMTLAEHVDGGWEHPVPVERFRQ